MPSEPLILLPGMMCDERMWADIPRRIQDCSGQILFGEVAGADTIEEIAAMLLRQAPERFAVAGLSMGGIVAMEIWRQAPGRVTRLALLNTNARADAAEKRETRLDQIRRVKQGELREVIREELKPTYPSPFVEHNLGLKNLILNMALTLGAEVFEQQSKALADRKNSLDLMKNIGCPTLVLCGEHDTLCPPAYHVEMAELLPWADMQVIPRCGHLSSLEHPEPVASAMRRWLRMPAGREQNEARAREQMENE